MYLYSLSPIDWWQGWMTEEQFEKNCEEIYGPTEMGSAMAAYKVFRRRPSHWQKRMDGKGMFVKARLLLAYLRPVEIAKAQS